MSAGGAAPCRLQPWPFDDCEPQVPPLPADAAGLCLAVAHPTATAPLGHRFGGQAWIRHNEDLASLQAAAQRQLDRVRQQIEALNWQRQNEQVAAGEELQALEVRWGELISKNYEIGAAVAALEAHVEGARTVQQ